MDRATAQLIVEKTLEFERSIDETCMILRQIPDDEEGKRYLSVFSSEFADTSGDVILPIA